MSCLPQRCARQLLREPFQRGSLPLFLTPAFSPSRTQCFSISSPMQSRVGGAAISVPPEVSLNLVDIPKSATGARGKDVPKFEALIKGPKGMCCAQLRGDRAGGAKLINCRRDVSDYSFFLECEFRRCQLKSYAVCFGCGGASPARDVGCVSWLSDVQLNC